MSANFILQASKLLYQRSYNSDELRMIYEYISTLDNVILEDYYSNKTIMAYENDLEMFVETIDSLIQIFEDLEEYEKCEILLNKKADAITIIENNTI